MRSSARPPAALGHHVGVVGGEGERRLGALGGDVGHPLLAVEHGVGEPPQLGAVGCGHPHQLGDHVHGEQAGEVGDEVEAPALERRLQVLEGQLADARLQLGHPPGGEALAHQRAQPGVCGRVHGQERHRAVGVGAEGGRVERDAVGVGEALHVPEGRQHVAMAGEGPEVELLVAVDGASAPEPGVGRVRVLVDGVVVGAVRRRLHRGARHRCSPRPAPRRRRRRAGAGCRRAPSPRAAPPPRPAGRGARRSPGGRARPRAWPRCRSASSTRSTAGSARGPSAAWSRRWISRPIRLPHPLHVGPVAEQRRGAGGGHRRAVGRAQAHLAHHVRHPLGHRPVQVHRGGGSGLHATPEDLGEQVVLGAEVGVGGGRGHPGAPGDAADGDGTRTRAPPPRRPPPPPGAPPPRLALGQVPAGRLHGAAGVPAPVTRRRSRRRRGARGRAASRPSSAGSGRWPPWCRGSSR